MSLALIVHGGAGTMAPEGFANKRAGCREAVLAGWAVLIAGGTALDAAQAAVVALENNPSFNAGTGAVLTADGRAQLDAGMMSGADLAVGAVAGVERIKNPILLAREVLHSGHAVLAGAGAEQFAVEQGITLCDPAELITPAQRAHWRRSYADGDDADADKHTEPVPVLRDMVGAGLPSLEDDEHKHGTVGAVAVDASGHVAAATSTGGIAAKHPGRIGDTPLVGCGFYAEDGLGGVSSTGHGEDFIRLLLARRATEYLARGLSAQAAASAAITLLSERVHGSGGLILLDGHGRVGFARNTLAMASAYMREGMAEPCASV
ncbi:MAG TPA: isoaspartyl peptidase/L-asparaginase [Ktedonobacterales bacterium]|nr:isoaspartyl peptidase/L-asparaginase [Ktedonobacterales bacterium]